MYRNNETSKEEKMYRNYETSREEKMYRNYEATKEEKNRLDHNHAQLKRWGKFVTKSYALQSERSRMKML